jgi:hypothetical protein
LTTRNPALGAVITAVSTVKSANVMLTIASELAWAERTSPLAG